jgi:hypothetical protein
MWPPATLSTNFTMRLVDTRGAWKVLREKGQAQAIVRAVERGWAIVQEDGKGKSKVRSASLTEDGRRLAIKKPPVKLCPPP